MAYRERKGLVQVVSLTGSGARRAAAGQVVGNLSRSRLMVPGKGELCCPLSPKKSGYL